MLQNVRDVKHTIEPKISTQWFVSMKDLAKRAADSVRNDETRFVPKRYENNISIG